MREIASYVALALLFAVLPQAGASLGLVLRLFDGVTGWLIDVVFTVVRFSAAAA